MSEATTEVIMGLSKEEKARLAAELGVDEVFALDTPLWWVRLTARVTLTWRRELAFYVTLLALGFTAGWVVGRLVS